ncbi:hypothetical protein ACNOYE_30975 [Nannocystaceae bacterium ST9]
MPLRHESMELESLARRLREIVGRIPDAPSQAPTTRARRDLEVAFVGYRMASQPAELARVRSVLATLTSTLGGPPLAGLVDDLRGWMAALDPDPPPTSDLDMVSLAPSLPNRAALARLAGCHRVILIAGGSGAVDESGAPQTFNGIPRSPELEQCFSAMRQIGVTGRCVVADFPFSLAWLGQLVDLLAPGGVVLATWTAESGALAHAVSTGAREPAALVERACEALARSHPNRHFDSPLAMYESSDARLTRGRSPLEYLLLDRAGANANLAATRAMLRWFDQHLVGDGRLVRDIRAELGLANFVARALV